MKGNILSFDKETNTGLISGHNGERYKFTRDAMTDSGKDPKQGQNVDFKAEDENAVDIFILKTVGGEKSRVTAILLAFFLGSIGIHHFYLGNSGYGILSLIFCWTFIPAIFAFINFIQYLFMSDERFNEKFG